MEQIALAAPGSELSIWALFWQAGWIVKTVMIGLLFASVWTWAIIIDKTLAYGRMRRARPEDPVRRGRQQGPARFRRRRRMLGFLLQVRSGPRRRG